MQNEDKTDPSSLVFTAGNKICAIGVNLQVCHNIPMCVLVV